MFAILSQVTVTALAVWGGNQDEGESDGNRDAVATALATYCFDCHSGARPSARLDLERRIRLEPHVDDRVAWGRAAERVRLGEMPPHDAPQPSEDERLEIVTFFLQRSSVTAPPSPVRALRRLTRREYDHTVRDLIGLDLHLAQRLLPPDAGGGEGFDNCADTLYLPPLVMEGFLDAARLILDEAVIESATGVPDPARGDSESRLAMHRTVVVATPSPTFSETDAAREISRRFLRRAYRRIADERDIDRALSRFADARASGDSFTGAIRSMLLPILVSPRFLFRVDQPDESNPSVDLDQRHRIDDFSLASRLSYFLWASMPDDELLAISEANILRLPDVLASQVDRMLDDPRQRGLAEDFASQWLGIRDLADRHPPDSERFPDIDRPLLLDMVEEAVMTFSSLVEEDASLLQLIDADHVYINERLANHYHLSLEPATGRAAAGPLPPAIFRRVDVTDEPRGGVLGMGSVLRASSLPLRTSPVLRGKWILETLLGAPPSPPPPDAGALPPDDRLSDGLSPRERLERHRADPGCASCHDQIDPLGFALESFDAVGRRRVTQFGLPIDDQFEWNGHSGRGVDDLKGVLLERRDAFLRHFVRQLLGYALARPLDELDRPLIEQLTAELPNHANSIRWLIHQIVQSNAFGST